jgi:DNA-binding GntR family transcriptional regulator
MMDRHNPYPIDLDEIDRDAFEPAYNQLANILRRKIASGEYRGGERLPSESELCSQYQVSSITARRAIKILVEQDIAETRQGQGTFLKPLMLGSATFDLQGLQQIFSDKRTQVRIMGASAVNANERIAQKLQVEVGKRVIYIRRLLLREGAPIIYHREYLILDPTNPTVEAELEVTSLGGLFSGSGQTMLKRGDLSIEATVLNDDEASVLPAAAGTPAFRIEHIFYDFNDRVVSWGWFICQGDQLRFTTSVGV